MPTLANASSYPKSTSVDSGTISVFLTNLGKYNEGELIGEWLSLPTTEEQFQLCLQRIGIGGKQYEEYFITDRDSSVIGVTDYIEEYSNINELNYLANRLGELSHDEEEFYEAILGIGDSLSSIKDLINLVDNLDCYRCLWNVNDEYDLGYYWVQESGCYNLKDLGNLANYFDYEKLGRDVAFEERGTFTSIGYIYSTGEYFSEIYDGLDMPEVFRIL